MKILRIIYEWPPPWDGLSPHPYELTLAQQKMGHMIHVFCGRWPKSGPIENPTNIKMHTFFREPLAGTLTFTMAPFMFLYYLLWSEHNEIDIIHSHGHFGIWLYLYRFILKKVFPWSMELKIPLVAHFHNTVEGRKQALLESGGRIKWFSRFISWPLESFSDRLATKAADACIFVSMKTKQEAVKYYHADPSKCFVVETGVNTDLFKPVESLEKENIKKDLGLDFLPTDKLILNHGKIVERKNLHLLIEAFKHLPPNYKLILAGPGESSYVTKLRELVHAYGLEKRVVEIGYVPYKQAPILFQASDLFVLPSSFEGLPKVLLQSLSCGVPSLVSGFKLKEDIHGILYLANLEPAQIAKQIEELLGTGCYVDVMKVRKFYSWDVKAREVEQIYETFFKK